MPNIGRDPEITKNEIEAGRRGGEAAQQASDSLAGSYQSGAREATQAASVFGNAESQGQQNNETKRHNQMSEAQTSDQQDIERADRGLEQTGPSRADRLRQEMEQGRQDKQMNEPLEVQGPDSKTGTVQQSEQRKSLDTEKMASTKLSSQARMLEAQKRLQDAKIKGDKDLETSALKDLHEPIVSAAKLFDEGKNSWKNPTGDPTLWSNLQSTYGDSPDPAVQQELKSKTFGPAIGRLVQSHLNFEALKFTATTGHLPDGKLVDMASPEWQQFTATASGVKAQLAKADEITGGALSGMMKIDSIAKRNTFINKTAGAAMMAAMKPLQQQGQGGDSNPVPSQGGPNARPQQPGPGAQGSPAPDINRQRRALGGPNPNAGTDEQQLRAREDAGVQRQQAADEQRRRGGSGSEGESQAAEHIRRARSGY